MFNLQNQVITEREEAVSIDSGTISRHEHKGYILEMICPQAKPSNLVLRIAQFCGLFFVLYINLPQHLENCFINMYADDIVLFFTSLCTLEINNVAQHDLNWVAQSMESNKLILNQSKKKTILFGSRQSLSQSPIFVFSYTERS